MPAPKGKAVIFSAPSGSGKSTIVHALLKEYPTLEFSVSATTRSPRGQERDGIDYHFLSLEKFTALVKENAFVEYEEVYEGRYYGTLLSTLQEIWKRDHTVIFDVDVVGGVNLKKYFQQEALSFFIKAPTIQTLRERLTSRSTDTPAEIERRLEKAGWEMTFQDQFDHVIVNDNLETALSEIRSILDKFLK